MVGTALALGLCTWFAATTWVWTQLRPIPLEPRPPAAGTTLSAASCAPCHARIHEEWRASMMGRAMTDPVFVADYQAQGKPFICLRCHAPLAEQQPLHAWGLLSVRPLIPMGLPNPTFDAALQSEGVTCVVCHLEDGAMVGLLDGAQAPHPVRRADPQRVCARCHQLEIPPLSNLDRPITDTVEEWERWKAGAGRTDTCVDCHMPEVERVVGLGGPTRVGHAHTWHGAWDEEMLRSGLSTEAWREGDEVVVRLENLAGHNYPTGDPARALVVRAGNNEIVLARRVPLPRLVDEGDNTLLPGERREIRLPAADHIQVLYERIRFLDVEAEDASIVLFEHAL